MAKDKKFTHYDLGLIAPDFDSPLTDLIVSLNNLRDKQLIGSTHPQVFFQLKNIFHMLESIGSARIEGNNTTVAEYIETILEPELPVSEDIHEIQNMEKAMGFVEEHVENFPVNKMFVSEMHKLVVTGLNPSAEGDNNPGCFRKQNVRIANAIHCPPDHTSVPTYMEELFAFLAKKDSPKYDLLKVAIAHHRFVWVHPFSNGNGRTVRLLTYAMLVKYGFNVNAAGRLINPTAIFCNNRSAYYNHLAKADAGSNKGILDWCFYVLQGLEKEIKKIDKLLDYRYLKEYILFPAIVYSLERKHITETESRILKKAVDKQTIKAGDVGQIFSNKVPQEISRQIRKLLEKKMLRAEKDSPRKYLISFDNSYLLRGIIHFLGKEGFLPDK